MTLRPPTRAPKSHVQYIPGPDPESQKLYEPIVTILEVSVSKNKNYSNLNLSIFTLWMSDIMSGHLLKKVCIIVDHTRDIVSGLSMITLIEFKRKTVDNNQTTR